MSADIDSVQIWDASVVTNECSALSNTGAVFLLSNLTNGSLINLFFERLTAFSNAETDSPSHSDTHILPVSHVELLPSEVHHNLGHFRDANYDDII